MDFFEKQIESRNIFNGKIMQIYEDKVMLPNGKTASREICRHNGGVAVLAIDNDDRCVIVKQYRYAFGTDMYELPAGKLENDEKDPEKAALRELYEETGIIPQNIICLGEIYPSPGFCTEVLHLYLAYNLKLEKQNLDEDEFLDMMWIPVSKLREEIINGQINDAKTVSALALAEFKDWRKIIHG